METLEAEADKLDAFREVVDEALSSAGLTQRGVRVDSLHWRDADRLVICVEMAPDARFGVELFEQDSAYPGLARGPRYGTATRRGPGLVDPGDEATEPAHREAITALCHALAHIERGPQISSGGASDLPAPPAGLVGETLADALREALAGAPPAGFSSWEGPEVSVMARWGPVAEVKFQAPGRTLAFIISPRDDSRPTFRRSTNYELVYYSDDLAPEEHERLYGRDQEEIEAFSRWFLAWDGSSKAP